MSNCAAPRWSYISAVAAAQPCPWLQWFCCTSAALFTLKSEIARLESNHVVLGITQNTRSRCLPIVNYVTAVRTVIDWALMYAQTSGRGIAQMAVEATVKAVLTNIFVPLDHIQMGRTAKAILH